MNRSFYVRSLVLYIAAAVIVPEDGWGAADRATASVAPSQLPLVLGTLLVLIGIAGFANVWRWLRRAAQPS